MVAISICHPARLLSGALIIGERIATTVRANALVAICRDGLTYARQIGEVSREIATDAEHAADVLTEISADGIITPAEAARLRAHLDEIRAEAVTGKIISGSREPANA